MRIAGFFSNQFAGLRNINLNFSPGLNVIVGANETGKSTIVNAMFAVLFTSPTLKRSRSEDKEFMARYLPQPGGDFADGIIKLWSAGSEYSLYKRWGNQNQSTLMKPDGTIISIETEIDQQLRTLLPLGARTYQNIAFAPQSQMKSVLEKLRDLETIHSVSSLLRAAVMNLDGVSIDKLRLEIDHELEALLKRWDYENARPMDRKIYKSGVGTVLNSYYQQENLRREMKRVFDLEQELHQLSIQLHSGEERIQAVNVELNRLEPLEEDMLQRAALEPRLEALKRQADELRAVLGQWPACEAQLQAQQNAMDQLLQKSELITLEEQACRRQKEIETLEKTLQDIEQEMARLTGLNQVLQGLPEITTEDIKDLTNTAGKIATAAATLQAGRMLASVTIHPDLELRVTSDLNPETIFNGGEIRANGYLRLRVGQLAEIEVKSGEFDYEQVRLDYAAAQDHYSERLDRIGARDLNSAQQIKRQRDQINADITSTRQIIDHLLKGQVYEELVRNRQELGSAEATRPAAIIEQDKAALEKQRMDIGASLISLKNKIEMWKNDFHSCDDLLAVIVARQVETREIESQLGRLQSLPDGFSNTSEFRLHVKSLRDELKQVSEELRYNWHEYDLKERELPEESYEELKLQFETASQALARNLVRATILLRIKKALIETLAEKDANSFQPLADAFNRYLNLATCGKYHLGWLDEEFKLGMITQDEMKMPVHLLSSGTYDSVALAFRFALLEQIFPGGDGFVILDDCLVDLDADRRAEAVDIIRTYARENQVIFTTCSPETAALLGGNLIKLVSQPTPAF